MDSSSLERVDVIDSYVDISTSRRSEVWSHFLYSKELKKARCKICDQIFINHGTTGTLVNHLKNRHGVSLKRPAMRYFTNAVPTKLLRLEGEEAGVGHQRRTLGQVIEHLVAVDCFSFHQLATSFLVRDAFESLGYNFPKSAQSIRDIFTKEYGKTLFALKNQITAEKAAEKRVSISFDKSTTKQNRRKMSKVERNQQEEFGNTNEINQQIELKYIPFGDDCSESYRLATFKNFPSLEEAPDLARNGFRRLSDGSLICFSCGACHQHVTEKESNLPKWHQNNCQMQRKSDERNKPLSWKIPSHAADFSAILPSLTNPAILLCYQLQQTSIRSQVMVKD